ncbi:hypothetical protein BDZ90DRAFT_92665 [Jaminaea rosea]|uniref:Uncharacterized protein n=1 Tax=Jaminaea rosea TaxID=1569628 RepID=A0A316UHC9_9BASI|nr:hypothetical protein BDZ90DRAFT_92665 [Jaminaea rosea]PWN24676.1 hypothetical protein BDZ90DRAFT_92665 [Jaminaea rosea]
MQPDSTGLKLNRRPGGLGILTLYHTLHLTPRRATPSHPAHTPHAMLGLDLLGLGRLQLTKRELKKMNEERWAKEKEERDAKRAEERGATQKVRRERGEGDRPLADLSLRSSSGTAASGHGTHAGQLAGCGFYVRLWQSK